MTYFQFNKLMQGNPVDIRHQVTLENWRKYPFTKWSFVNVRNIIPNAEIQTCNNQAPNFDKKHQNLLHLQINHDGKTKDLSEVLKLCDTDAFLVMSKGTLVFEYFDQFTDYYTPHIVFSISKSITSLLLGVLSREINLDLNTKISKIIPETKGSAYENATVRNVLDMNVS